jgi:cytoskeletal protein RodZ
LSRGGRGPYGFGNVEQEAQDAEKDPAKAEGENVDDAAEPEAESAEVAAEPEEPPTLSFDDFIKQREEARANSAAFAPKSVRTVTDSQFAGLQSKPDLEDEANKAAAAAAAAKKDQRSTQKTQLLDVAFKFESQRDTRFTNDRRGRGDRDFSKGGRGRGRGGGRGRGSAPAPLNSGDFPSL